MNDLFLVYGKIIIDSIRLRSGTIVAGKLGGGGPQAAFGMRLWHSQVALLTRSGTDLEPEHIQTLKELDLDLSGWVRFADLPTPRGLLEYDEQEYLRDTGLMTGKDNWHTLLSRPLSLSDSQRQAAAIHLVTEFGSEAMVRSAHDLQHGGALFSLEPIFDKHSCPDPKTLLRLVGQVDIVVPDWPAARRYASSDDPLTVLRTWSTFGPRAIAIRHGSHGSYVWDREHDQFWHVPVLPVDVIDPTGAGNAYGGGWCAGWHASQDARVAGCQGTVAAALMISHAGMPPLTAATRQQAAELLEIALRQTVRLDR